MKQAELAGMIALQKIDWKGKTTNFGYWLAPNFEGKGIMVRCVKELILFAFKILHLNRLQISCAEDNVKSRALPEKLGFKLEGILRENYCVHGKVHNLVVYSLLRNEWVEDMQK